MTLTDSLSGRTLPRTLTGLAVAASALGLLLRPIGIYDDSILLVGARLVGAGLTPYVDFYAHYGPLGYTILAPLVRLFGDPGVALRAGEITILAGIAVLLHVLFRSLGPPHRFRELAVPFLVMGFSDVAVHPAFFGFGFATAALILFLLAQNAGRLRTATLLNVAAGVALAAAALTRPAFAAYVGGSLLFLHVVSGRPRSGVGPNWLSAPGVFFGAAALTTVGGLLLHPGITPARALDATVLFPARLLAQGTRYLDPEFLPSRASLARGIATGAALFATTIGWTIAVRNRRVLALAASCCLAGGVLPLLLAYSDRRGQGAALLALALFALAFLVAFAARDALQESALLRASAAFGLAAAAFGHYFWARADAPHLVLLLTLALTGGALLSTSLRAAGGFVLAGAFALAYASALHPYSFPAMELVHDDLAESLRAWPCSVPPEDARNAVAFADRRADPRSRFVAVGTSQAWSFGNPAQLFLISSRLPYTRWFQYDPGVQSSAAVQKEMERELEASGSRTAVVWKAGKYLWGGEFLRRGSRSPFDDAFDRLYPFTAAKFGDYEVRMRDPDSSAARPPRGR